MSVEKSYFINSSSVKQQSKINELRGKGSDSPLRGTAACANESHHLGEQKSGCMFLLFIFAQRRDKIQKGDCSAEVKRKLEPTGLHTFFQTGRFRGRIATI